MNIVKALSLCASLALGAIELRAVDPSWEWVQIGGGTNSDFGSGVAVSSTGEVYWSGYISSGSVGSSVPISGKQSGFWAKVDSAGTVSKATFATGANENALAVDSAGFVHSVGNFYSSLQLGATSLNVGNASGTFVVRFDNALNPLWVTGGIVGSAPPVASPAVTAEGELLLGAGFSSASIDGTVLTATGGSNQDALMAKLQAASGSLIWMKRGGGIDEESAHAICFDAEGNVYVGGYSQSTTVAFGPITVTAGGEAGFVAKLNSAGTAQWVNEYLSSGARSQVVALKVAENGDVIVGGGTSDATSVAIPLGSAAKGIFARLTADGATVWSKSIANFYVRDIALANDGTIVFSAALSGTITIDSKSFTSRGDSDLFVGRFGANGNLIWGKTAGGGFQDYPGQIAIAPDGSIYFAGTLRDGGSFDSIYVEGRGGGDAFIAKLSPGTAPSPQFTTQPQSTVVSGGMNIELTAAAVGDVPLTYQWWFNGAPLTGQTSPSLVIANAGATNAGSYFVVAHNVAGDTPSEIANVSYTDAGSLQLSVHPSLTIFGTPGRTYRIDYAVETRSPAVWTTITNISLATTPYVWQDTNAAIADKRFYRVLLQP